MWKQSKNCDFMDFGSLDSSINIKVKFLIYFKKSSFFFRQHVIQWRRLHPQLYSLSAAPSVGLQAVMFNSDKLDLVVDRLREAPSFNAHMDTELTKQRRALGLEGFLLEPNLVR